MSAFAKSMDNQCNRKKTAKGTVVRKKLGFSNQASILELWQNLKRGTSETEIKEKIKNLCAVANKTTSLQERTEILTLLCRLIVQKRDCREGGGEKDVVYKSLLALYSELPETTLSLIALLPKFGYWKDLKLLANLCKNDEKSIKILDCIVKTLARGILSKNSLCCKWAPREKKSCAWLADKVRIELNMSKAKYRKFLSTVNKVKPSVETLMSSQRFRDIDPVQIPSKCLKVHRCAFLDEDKTGVRLHYLDEDPQLADREICRKKFMEAFSSGKKLKGARNFPYEIVRQVLSGGEKKVTADLQHLVDEGILTYDQALEMGVQSEGDASDLQREQLNSMWGAIVDDVKKQISKRKKASKLKFESKEESKDDSLQKDYDDDDDDVGFDPSMMVPMSDVSGSMTCFDSIPLENSIALGLLLSEVGHPAFRHRVMTFDAKPEWVVFDKGLDFVGRVKVLRDSLAGTSTNFEAAMKLIADVVRQNKLPEDQVPGIVCFSDMQFDEASSENGNATHYERVEKLFTEVGKEISGSPYKAPRMCFWDLAAGGGGSNGFPVTSTDKGVMLISGFSPSLLKLVMTGERMDTPWKTFLKAVRDRRYDEVRDVAMMAMEIDPTYVVSK
jgi:hypothetical protein